MGNYIEHRPWGSFENLLDEDYCKVKRIIVKPGQRLSSQYHHKRSEVWVIVQGKAVVTLEEKDSYLIQHINGVSGQVIKIPVGTIHRVTNEEKEDLIFIETQTGTYFGEDDIVRIEDDYNRK
jgi:mannose-6-phosphate isomerase-like protein (cupin superfamily)